MVNDRVVAIFIVLMVYYSHSMLNPFTRLTTGLTSIRIKHNRKLKYGGMQTYFYLATEPKCNIPI